jgi:hypothetical protein
MSLDSSNKRGAKRIESDLQALLLLNTAVMSVEDIIKKIEEYIAKLPKNQDKIDAYEILKTNFAQRTDLLRHINLQLKKLKPSPMVSSGSTARTNQQTRFDHRMATPVQKFNHMLDAVLNYYTTEGREKQLQAPGVLRVSGANHAMKQNIMNDPVKTLAENAKFDEGIHDVTMAVKYNFKTTPWSSEAQAILMRGMTTSTSLDAIENNLIRSGCLQEAKALHNMLHFAYLIKSEETSPKQRVNAAGAARVLLPLIEEVAGIAASLENLAHSMLYGKYVTTAIITDPQNVFKQSFDMAFP